MTARASMTWHHAGLALLAILAFTIAGLAVSMSLVLMFEVGWIVIYLFWPFLLLHLVMSLIFHGGYELVRALIREKPDTPTVPPTLQPQVPWLREKSGWIGFSIGVSITVILELTSSWT